MILKNRDLLAGLLYLSLPGIFFVALVLILLFIPEFRSGVMYDSDTNWLLKTGEIIVNNGFQIPQYDIFSYTVYGKEWIVYQWLFEVFLYISYAFSGLEGVGLVTTCAFALVFTIIFVIQLKENVNIFYAAISTALGAYCAQLTWYARPAIITYIFIAVLILIFYLAEKNKHNYLWFLPLIFLIWANMHLGFMSGLTLLLVFFVYNIIKLSIKPTKLQASLIKKLFIIIILSFLASLITPYGIKLYPYLNDLAHSYYMNDNIKELLSPNFHKKMYASILITLFIIISLGKYSRNISSFNLIALAIAACSTLMFVRNIPFYGIFVALIIGQQIQCLHNEVLKSDSVYNVLSYPATFLNHYNSFIKYCQSLDLRSSKLFKINPSLIVSVIFLVILFSFSKTPIMKDNFKFSYHHNRPLKAYKFVSKFLPPGKFYTESTWGSYAILHLYPKYRVFIDTRFDMYGEEFFKISHKLKLGSTNWDSTLKKYNINWILISPSSQFNSKIVKSQYENWFKVYEDKVSILYMYRNKKNLDWYNHVKDKIPKYHKETDQ